MKKLVGGWIGSIFGFLLGGFLLCFPQTIPFATTLTIVSGLLFVALGVLTLFMKCGCLEEGHSRQPITQKQVRTQVCEYLDEMKAQAVEMLGDYKYMTADSLRYFMDLLIREIYEAGEKTDESKD